MVGVRHWRPAAACDEARITGDDDGCVRPACRIPMIKYSRELFNACVKFIFKDNINRETRVWRFDKNSVIEKS